MKGLLCGNRFFGGRGGFSCDVRQRVLKFARVATLRWSVECQRERGIFVFLDELKGRMSRGALLLMEEFFLNSGNAGALNNEK